MTAQGSSPERKAFTLVELLAVVAICSLLVALMFPALSKARLAARKAGTIGNMRQLGVATLSYAGDHQGMLPGPSSQGLFRGYTRSSTDGISFLLAPYLGLPDQSTLSSGQGIIVPQLLDPGYMGFNPQATSSVPQYVQKIAYPTTSSLAGRRPFGVSEADPDDPKRPPVTLLQLSALRPELRWLLTTVDQQVAGMTATWKTQTPPAPLYGVRFRLYSDGRVASVDADDKN